MRGGEPGGSPTSLRGLDLDTFETVNAIQNWSRSSAVALPIFLGLCACAGQGATTDSSSGGADPEGNGGATNSGENGGSPGGSGSGGTSAGGSGGMTSGGNTAGGAAAGGAPASGGSPTGGETGTTPPTPAFSPDVVLSVSNRRFGDPELTTWSRNAALVEAGTSECSVVVEAGACVQMECDEDLFATPPFLDLGEASGSYDLSTTHYQAQFSSNTSDPVASDFFRPLGGVLAGGERLIIGLSGGALPAFSRELTFPTRLITTNVGGTIEDYGYALPLDVTQGIVLTWENGAPGVLYQIVGSHYGSPKTLDVRCEFESTDGQGEVPPEVLTGFATGDRISTVTVSAWRGLVESFRVSVATGAETMMEEGGLGVFLQVQ